MGEALAAAQDDLFDAYLYSLYHPCEISPHELIALINAHREVMAVQKAARREALWADIEAKQEALGLEAYRGFCAGANAKAPCSSRKTAPL